VTADAKDLVSSKLYLYFMYLYSNYNIFLTFLIELLHKDKSDRLSIKEALDHPWFVGANESIS
jgi:hypothetical protein